ncbi:pyocin knob domain-containing protein [Leuconostoc mesenteroides]|uniref:pyocin knob domain-containing protein n=1 Tax=Leuconostoc mesenteroides TaxID=1245 RepID=UPI0038843D1B
MSSFDIKGTGVYSDKHIGIEASAPFNSPTGNVSSDWTRISSNGVANGSNPVIIYFNSLNTALDVYIKLPKLESGNIPTDWTPAPEDVDGATAKAQLTADQATTALNAYKTNADGRISKAQSDIVQTAKDVTTKVSQTDYNAKTGDLSTKVSTAQQTADNAVTTIGNYKTSNDNRVKATESKITANAEAITQKVSQTDYNQKTGELSGKISEINQTAGKISQTVSDVKTQVDGLSVGGRNLLLDTATRTAVGPNVANNTPSTFRWTLANSATVGSLYTAWGNNTLISLSFDWSITGTTIAGAFNPQWNGAPWGIGATGAPGVTVSNTNTSGHYTWSSTTQTGWSGSTANQFTLRTDNLQGTLTITNLKFEQGNLPTAWMPAPEDTDNKISTVSQTVDSISSIVSDPTTGLTKRVQTAEGSLSKVQGTDIPALQNATFWQPYSSLNFNDYTKQGSFFFNTTATKTNGPVSGNNSWTYLMVEQGVSDNSRIKQTAWYDGVNGVKITYARTLNSGTWSPWYANDNDSVTTISQTNSDIKQEISDRKTGDNNTLQSSKDFTTSSITSYDKGVQTQLTQTSDAILAKVGATNLFPNSEFAQNFGYAGSGTVVVSGSVKNNIDNKYSGTVSVTSTSAGYQGYWTNKIPVYGGKKYSASVLVHYTNNSLSKGLAMLDIWFYDKDNKRISSATRSTGQVSSPYWVKLSNEGFTAPINAVSVQVSLLVNNAGAGQVATFSQPLVTATEKLQEYTPNDDMSAQLSLFKDNWSIGITDNISKITSGIVGNASQMSLISKNVTIDAPNTQIKGTAWINSAMIANGAIGSAQIGDATITSAKIATLDVAKLTGNVSNFIQSNWNGLYQSVKISPIGMTISTSQGSTAQFNQDGLVLDGALGTTNVLNGQIELISSSNEYLGTFQHETMPEHDNVDYLMIKLAGWHTSKPGDSDYDLNSDSSNTIRGGDGIGFGVTNSVGTYDMKMSWDSSLVAGYKGRKAGWHVEDIMTWHQPTYFEGGFDVAQQFSSTDRRALHIQGATLSNGHKWFGFFDTPSQAGFGTDDTNDVLFYVKGKSYSLYTMLNKLSML